MHTQNNNRKPMTIEESIHLGYRKKLDMSGLDAVMASEGEDSNKDTTEDGLTG